MCPGRGAANVWEVVGARSCVLFRSPCLLFLKPYITLDSYVTGALIPTEKKVIDGRCVSCPTLQILSQRFRRTEFTSDGRDGQIYQDNLIVSSDRSLYLILI